MYVPHISDTVITECPLCNWSDVTKNANRDSLGYYSTCPTCGAMYDITKDEHDEIKSITERIRAARREAMAAQQNNPILSEAKVNKMVS